MSEKIYIYQDSLGLPRFSEDLFLEDTLGWQLMKSFDSRLNFSDTDISLKFGRNLRSHDKLFKNSLKTSRFLLNKFRLNWLLGNNKKIIFIDSKVHRTTNSLVQDIPRIISSKFSSIIIHIGINDCVPRLVSLENRNKISNLPPFLKSKVIKILHKFRPFLLEYNFSRRHKSAWVSIDKFEKNLLAIKSLCKKANVNLKIVNISPPNEYLKSRSIGSEHNILDYNEIIMKSFKEKEIIDIHSLFSKKIEDYLLPDGHHLTKLGFNQLAEKISGTVKVD